MKTPRNYLGVLEQLQGDKIGVDQNKCAIVRNRNAKCMKCAEVCTSDCITLVDGRLAVNADNCIGCGTCATVCPAGALESLNPDDEALFNACVASMQANSGKSVVACRPLLEKMAGRYDPAKVAPVECLGRVDESLLVLLARARAGEVVLAEGMCPECRHNPGSTMARAVVQTANELLCAWGGRAIASLADALPDYVLAEMPQEPAQATEEAEEPQEEAAEEGALEQLDAMEAEEEKRPLVVHVKEDGTLPHHLPKRRGRLLKGLTSAFGEPEEKMVRTRLWGHVEIDKEKCVNCRACAIFCPTEAIKRFEDEDGSSGILHFPYRCVKCGCCEDICPKDAVTLSDDVSTTDLVKRSHVRYEMRPSTTKHGPHQMYDSLKELMGIDFFYER